MISLKNGVPVDQAKTPKRWDVNHRLRLLSLQTLQLIQRTETAAHHLVALFDNLTTLTAEATETRLTLVHLLLELLELVLCFLLLGLETFFLGDDTGNRRTRHPRRITGTTPTNTLSATVKIVHHFATILPTVRLTEGTSHDDDAQLGYQQILVVTALGRTATHGVSMMEEGEKRGTNGFRNQRDFS